MSKFAYKKNRETLNPFASRFLSRGTGRHRIPVSRFVSKGTGDIESLRRDRDREAEKVMESLCPYSSPKEQGDRQKHGILVSKFVSKETEKKT